MKKLFLTIGLLVGFIAQAGDTQVIATITTNTPTVLLTGRYMIEQILLTADSANNTTFKFYDCTGTNTNVVQTASYTRLSYPTNYTTTFTNLEGIILTNTFVGQYTSLSNGGAVTNERPRIITYVVPASATRELSVSKLTSLGLLVQANHAGTVEVIAESK